MEMMALVFVNPAVDTILTYDDCVMKFRMSPTTELPEKKKGQKGLNSVLIALPE